MSSTIAAPWTPEQVDALNVYQQLDAFHPYTCGGDFCTGVLFATPDGWICTAGDCGFNQGWAYAFSFGPWPA